MFSQKLRPIGSKCTNETVQHTMWRVHQSTVIVVMIIVQLSSDWVQLVNWLFGQIATCIVALLSCPGLRHFKEMQWMESLIQLLIGRSWWRWAWLAIFIVIKISVWNEKIIHGYRFLWHYLFSYTDNRIRNGMETRILESFAYEGNHSSVPQVLKKKLRNIM